MKPGESLSDEVKAKAKELFLSGWAMEEIAQRLGTSTRVLYTWKKKGEWETQPDTLEIALTQRIIELVNLPNKTPEQLAEFTAMSQVAIDLRVKKANIAKTQAEAVAISKGLYPAKKQYNKGGHTEDGEPAPRRGGREKKVKNDISHITPEMLDDVFNHRLMNMGKDENGEIIWQGAFEYQKLWRAMKFKGIDRFILKSRQIGATFILSFEAFEDAILTGDNQIFLSASRDQAEVFKGYIIAFAKIHFDLELKGDGCITLSNGAELRFLSTNSNTAQSYHGHLYRDECFWVANYAKMRKVTSGMSAHDKWRITDFSTPSATSHEAYQYWSGEFYNAELPEDERIEFDVSHKALKDGVMGPDDIWRHMVTVEDAAKQGCNLFNIDKLKKRHSKAEFDNLFMCKFIDDSQSVFPLQMMLNCTVEQEEWKDYDINKQRPFANREVALGYDPSRVGDNAALAILATPTPGANYWRVLRTENYRGSNFQGQSQEIKNLCESHNVAHIGIDKTGMGLGLYELVEGFFPLVTPINYSVEVKTQLVIKALDVIANGRFKYLVGNSDITRSFMMISKKVTSNNSITYASNRSEKSGHADIAWSIMHALKHESINYNRASTTVS